MTLSDRLLSMASLLPILPALALALAVPVRADVVGQACSWRPQAGPDRALTGPRTPAAAGPAAAPARPREHSQGQHCPRSRQGSAAR